MISAGKNLRPMALVVALGASALPAAMLVATPAALASGYQPYYDKGQQQVWDVDPQATPQGSLRNYPTYPYDPNTDPKHPPYVTPIAHDPKPDNKYISLLTQTGFDLGLQISDYRYQEHVVSSQEFMHLTGPTFGVTFAGTKSYASGFFWGVDTRLAYGIHDYSGSDVDANTGISIPSTRDGETDLLFEARLLGGHDFLFEDAFNSNTDLSIAPYAGLGFRYLSNDGTGTDSNGVSGYDRYSHYVYIPLGITPRIRVTDMTRLSLNMEYDQLIYGWQVSSLGKVNPGEGDLTNSQHDGYGLRGSLMYEWPSWSFGPFFNYWNINQSDTACDSYQCGVEPHNQTLEYGLQGKYHF